MGQLTHSPAPGNGVLNPKPYLDKDPNYFKTHVLGSGPFKFKNYTPGSTFEGERNLDYFIKGRPYLDGYRFFISTETSVRAAAIRSGRAYVEFRNMPGPEVEAIKKQLGDKVVVQETGMSSSWGIAVNHNMKPFNDVRVRKALTLGIDRYTAGKVLFPINGLKLVGGSLRPGSEFALPDAGAVVDAERGALGQGEELRGSAESILQPEAAGRVARGGLRDRRARPSVAIAISGIGGTAYTRNSGKSVVALQMEAALAAIADAGLDGFTVLQLRGLDGKSHEAPVTFAASRSRTQVMCSRST